MWEDLGRALCLMLVLEGMLPFLNPSRWRAMLASVAQVPDRHLRLFGLASMSLGAALLYLLN